MGEEGFARASAAVVRGGEGLRREGDCGWAAAPLAVLVSVSVVMVVAVVELAVMVLLLLLLAEEPPGLLVLSLREKLG